MSARRGVISDPPGVVLPLQYRFLGVASEKSREVAGVTPIPHESGDDPGGEGRIDRDPLDETGDPNSPNPNAPDSIWAYPEGVSEYADPVGLASEKSAKPPPPEPVGLGP